MEADQTQNNGTTEERLMLKEPTGHNYFSRDMNVLEKIHAHFATLIENIRQRCESLGINIRFVGPWSGEMRIAGPSQNINTLIAELRSNQTIIN